MRAAAAALLSTACIDAEPRAEAPPQTASEAESEAGPEAAPARRTLRVCADPNNLPFSNAREEGFENRLAQLLAAQLDATVRYTWWPQRRAFLRNTLRAGKCDVVMGVPASWELVLATRPYYRSTYVFVTRRGAVPRIASLDDPALRRLRVGVHLMGDDGANAPPAHALAARGIVSNVRGYPIYGDYSRESPAAGILDALAAGEIDVAIVWGPLGGWHARRLPVPVDVVPVTPQIDVPFLPLVYDIALGVRRDDPALAQELDEALRARAPEIRALLVEYGVPLVERPGAQRVARAPGPE